MKMTHKRVLALAMASAVFAPALADMATESVAATTSIPSYKEAKPLAALENLWFNLRRYDSRSRNTMVITDAFTRAITILDGLEGTPIGAELAGRIVKCEEEIAVALDRRTDLAVIELNGILEEFGDWTRSVGLDNADAPHISEFARALTTITDGIVDSLEEAYPTNQSFWRRTKRVISAASNEHPVALAAAAAVATVAGGAVVYKGGQALVGALSGASEEAPVVDGNDANANADASNVEVTPAEKLRQELTTQRDASAIRSERTAARPRSGSLTFSKPQGSRRRSSSLSLAHSSDVTVDDLKSKKLPDLTVLKAAALKKQSKVAAKAKADAEAAEAARVEAEKQLEEEAAKAAAERAQRAIAREARRKAREEKRAAEAAQKAKEEEAAAATAAANDSEVRDGVGARDDASDDDDDSAAAALLLEAPAAADESSDGAGDVPPAVSNAAGDGADDAGAASDDDADDDLATAIDAINGDGGASGTTDTQATAANAVAAAVAEAQAVVADREQEDAGREADGGDSSDDSEAAAAEAARLLARADAQSKVARASEAGPATGDSEVAGGAADADRTEPTEVVADGGDSAAGVALGGDDQFNTPAATPPASPPGGNDDDDDNDLDE